MRLKHFLITGIGLMLTGGLLAGATYTLGAQKSLTWDNGPRLIDMVTETKKNQGCKQNRHPCRKSNSFSHTRIGF